MTTLKQNENIMRIDSLDYLRGMMALFIMIHHYCGWVFPAYKEIAFFGIAVYAVATFYILSGLTFFYVYNTTLTLKTTHYFFIKRIFRIIPLLSLSVFLNIFLFHETHSLQTIFLNVTGLFGFFDHDNYITTGSWSIGNEIVAYCIFPIVLLLSKWKHFTIELFFIFSLSIGIYFAFNLVNKSESSSTQWSLFIHPLNQLFLFFGGVLIGKIVGERKNNKLSLILFLICGLTVFLYPPNADVIKIVSGWNRLIFSLLSFTLIAAFLIFEKKINKNLHWVLSKFGHLSYSIYLIHALLFWYLAKYINPTNRPLLILTICIPSTIIVSWFLYHKFEIKLIDLGNRIIKKLEKK